MLKVCTLALQHMTKPCSSIHSNLSTFTSVSLFVVLPPNQRFKYITRESELYPLILLFLFLIMFNGLVFPVTS